MTTDDTASSDSVQAGSQPKAGLLVKVQSRPVWLVVFLLSLAAFGISLAGMIKKIDEFNASEDRPARFAFQPVTSPSFTYAGSQVSFKHETLDVGLGNLRVSYGTEELVLPVRVSGIDELPDLRRYENWMRVLRFFETTGMTVAAAQQRLEAGEIADRLAIAIRIPPAGADERTWGRVGKSEWRYELHEFIPATDQQTPTFRSEMFIPPESERSFNRRIARASRNNEPIPERRSNELKPGTWQHDAAQLTMPDNRGFTPVFGADAFGSFGWTFPVAGVSAIPLAISMAFLLSPRREEVEAR